MKTKVVFGLVLSFLVLAIFGCGGGGGGGGAGATQAVLLTVTQSTTTASTINNPTNNSVTITANATKNGVAVPDGTLVAFTVKSGAGTLSAPSAATVNGAASVTLSSATNGATVVVTASNGGASADSAAVNFIDPNQTGSIIVTATPTTGLIPGTIPGTVTISANVMRLGGNGIIPGSPVLDGTIVSFTVTSGNGTLSAASAPTTAGVATVTLTSTAANASVTVTAAASPVSGTVTVPFITQPTQAIVKLQTIGTLPANTMIAVINATVTYATNKGLSITAGNVVASGAGSGAGATFSGNVSTPGEVVITYSNLTAPIAEGEFATLTFNIAAGNLPVASDFGIASYGVTDDGNQPIAGITVTIMSVTVQ